MKNNILYVIAGLLLTNLVYANKPAQYHGTALCAHPDYECRTVRRGQTWARLFPDKQQRDIVQRVNRSYNYLWAGKKIAVPKALARMSIYDVSPFPLKIKPDGEKMILIDQDKLAWAAYDEAGKLVKWGPISSGKNFCEDTGRPCVTATGVFRVFSKEDKYCQSNTFPLGEGGAKMPYCMYFYKGFAMHGSNDMPGRRASHGCIRLFTRDAKWLNEEFVEVANPDFEVKGTRVVVQRLTYYGRNPLILGRN